MVFCSKPYINLHKIIQFVKVGSFTEAGTRIAELLTFRRDLRTGLLASQDDGIDIERNSNDLGNNTDQLLLFMGFIQVLSAENCIDIGIGIDKIPGIL